MKVFEVEFTDKAKKEVKEVLNSDSKTKRNFFKSFVGSFIVTTMLLSSAVSLKADVFSTFFNKAKSAVSWHRAAGAAAGMYLSKKKDSDLKKALKAAGGVLAAEIIIKTVQGEKVDLKTTSRDMVFSAAGAALTKRNYSKSKKAAFASGAVIAGEIATKAMQINFGRRNNNRDAEYRRTNTNIGSGTINNDDLGRTHCEKVTERIYRNGQLVEERTREICRSQADLNTYDGADLVKKSFSERRKANTNYNNDSVYSSF